MKRYLTLLLAVVITVGLMVGCQPSEPATSVSAPDTTTTGTTTAPSTEPQGPNETGALQLVWTSMEGTDNILTPVWKDTPTLYPYMVFETLIKLDNDGETIVPKLAKNLDISDDGLIYTFTLVDNAKWHDGGPLTAEDVIWSFNTVLKVPDAGVRGTMTGIVGAQDVYDGKADTVSGVKADGNKVTVTLTAPDNQFLQTVVAALYILPKHLLQDVDPTLLDKDETFWSKPVGTGPYKLDEVSYPNYFTLIRNDDYYGVRPNIKKVVFTSYATGGNEAINAAAIAGQLDFMYGTDTNDINIATNIVNNNSDIKMIVVPATYQRNFAINVIGSQDGKWNSDMAKKEVRQALNLIIDKGAVAQFYGGQAVPVSTKVNPALPTYNTDIPLPARDIETAKTMLTEAGFDFSRPIRLAYYYTDQTTADIMELLKQNFSEAGITLETILNETDDFYATGNFDLEYFGAFAPDPIMEYLALQPDGGQWDLLFGHIDERTSTYKALLDQYRATNDPAEKKRIGDEIQAQGYQDAYMIPVYGLNKVVLYNSARLSLPEHIFDMDIINVQDMHFDQWNLLQ